jgi:RNA ligase
LIGSSRGSGGVSGGGENDMIDKVLLEQMIEERYVSKRKHPFADLYIYNYTAKAQYDWVWNDVIEQCRGLIMDGAGNIIARPFRKFFSLEQLQFFPDRSVPMLPFEVYEKLDGSLGILYFVDDTPYIATRGSFESEQSTIGTQILRSKYADCAFEPGRTYLFEIIHPSNRIVVDYGETKDLVLLAVIDNDTGAESLPDIGFPMPKRYDGLTDLNLLKTLEEANQEGFVVRFENGFRVKVKFEEYKRLHRLVTQVSNVVIWEYLKDGLSFDELIERVPDEFYDWLSKTKQEIIDAYSAIEMECQSVFKTLRDRKETALYFQTQKYPTVLFSMLDGKDYTQGIWKMVKPKWTQPFKTEEL